MLRSLSLLLLLASSLSWAKQYPATAMVLTVDTAKNTMLVSCQDIPGFMSAMTMPLKVKDPKELADLAPGEVVEFTLVVHRKISYAEHVRVKPYQSSEQDPFTAERLKLLKQISGGGEVLTKQLSIGERVPDFTLIDTDHRSVSLSQFTGKVVALNFIYTSCALPNFCYRTANNFNVLQKRYRKQLGTDLVLLTVTFDPDRDQPEVLARYARTWKADPATWHFLTGPAADVHHVTDMFGMDFFPDEGLMSHSLHTAVIDRSGRLIANIEGNQYSPEQLGDLVQTVLSQRGTRAANQSR
jgi:protein SCO1/2